MSTQLEAKLKRYSLHSTKEIVSSFAEFWKYPKTGAQSLHARIKILPGDVISTLGSREYVEVPNYLSVQIDSNKHIHGLSALSDQSIAIAGKPYSKRLPANFNICL